MKRSVTRATTNLHQSLKIAAKSFVSRTAHLAMLFSAIQVGARVFLNTKNRNVYGSDLSINFIDKKTAINELKLKLSIIIAVTI